MIKFRRNGDVNLHPISTKEADRIRKVGKVIKTNGEYIMARGEATGSLHKIVVDNPDDLIVRQSIGEIYIEVLAPARDTHTHDHKTTTVIPGIYIQVPEREIDHFADSVERKVID